MIGEILQAKDRRESARFPTGSAKFHGPARRSVQAKALEQPVYRPRAVKPKCGKGAKYNRAATRKAEQD